jgi:hypothetical protein
MGLAEELDIARQKRVGTLLYQDSKPEAKPAVDGENLFVRTARAAGLKKTADADRELQSKYRTRKGLDEFNYPVDRSGKRITEKRTSSGRR